MWNGDSTSRIHLFHSAQSQSILSTTITVGGKLMWFAADWGVSQARHTVGGVVLWFDQDNQSGGLCVSGCIPSTVLHQSVQLRERECRGSHATSECASGWMIWGTGIGCTPHTVVGVSSILHRHHTRLSESGGHGGRSESDAQMLD